MKINGVELNCRRKLPEAGTDQALFYFRSPVCVASSEGELAYPAGTAVVRLVASGWSFRPAGKRELRYDCVAFRGSSADKQYAAAVSLPIDEPVTLRDDTTVSILLRALAERFAGRSRNRAEYMETCMRLIFLEISEAAAPDETTEEEKLPRYSELKALRDSIYAEPTNAWPIEDICADLGMSKTYFHRLYFKAFGTTCRRDVIESRLSYAEELLRTTQMSVGDIAVECGYDSESYFMRQFKQRRGLTPTEYRRRASR